jgi:hypothetical protein
MSAVEAALFERGRPGGKPSDVFVGTGGEGVYFGENDSLLNGDVSMGDNLGSLIAMKPKPSA